MTTTDDRFQLALEHQLELNKIYRTLIDKLESRVARLEEHIQRLEDREDLRSAADQLAN